MKVKEQKRNYQRSILIRRTGGYISMYAGGSKALARVIRGVTHSPKSGKKVAGGLKKFTGYDTHPVGKESTEGAIKSVEQLMKEGYTKEEAKAILKRRIAEGKKVSGTPKSESKTASTPKTAPKSKTTSTSETGTISTPREGTTSEGRISTTSREPSNTNREIGTKERDFGNNGRRTVSETPVVGEPVGRWTQAWRKYRPYVIGAGGMYIADRIFSGSGNSPAPTSDDMYIQDPYMQQMMGAYQPMYPIQPMQPTQPVTPMQTIEQDSQIQPTDTQSSTYNTDAIGTLLTDLLRYAGDRETLRNSGIMGYYKPIIENQQSGIYRSLRDMPASAQNWYLDLIGYLASKGVQNKEQLIKALKDNQQYSTLLQQYGIS